MSNKTIRVRTTPDGSDKYLKVKLDQEFDFIEVLSLKISQEEAYRNFCSDYGVVVGRVIINSGYGVPNARVSIFVPIDDVDINDPEIKGLYPYEIVTDKDSEGIRYNLLPRNSETDNECFTPVGTFPTKREILDNSTLLNVYCKYYKFTTTTNYAGDFMFFGLPVGNHAVHVDVDISDMGIASQRPYDSISQGSPVAMFDSSTKFKGGTNLDNLVQIKSANSAVNVQPFWGDVNSCELGISRLDIDLNYNIRPCAIFTGSIFGDNEKNSVNKNCRPRRDMGELCKQSTGEGTIEMIRKNIDGDIEKLDIEGGKLIDDKGTWAYQIPMNLDYLVTNEFGDLVPSEDPNKGIPTRTSVRFKISLDETGGLGRLRTRAKYLVPHNPNSVNEIDYEFSTETKDSSFRDMYWNKIYTVSNFITRFQRANSVLVKPVKNRNMVAIKDIDSCVGDKNPFPYSKVNTQFNPLFFIICLIMKILEFVIFIINKVVVTILNLIMIVVNAIIQIICSIIRLIRRIWKWIFGRRRPRLPSFCNKKYWVPCIFATCPFDDESSALFIPGCSDSNGRREALVQAGAAGTPTKIYDDLFELSNCVAFELARAMNLFQFDFYNDWINGTLYAYLLKYKRRKRREKYCSNDCSGSNCITKITLDTCYNGGGDSQNELKSIAFREGVIKKYKGEFYYAPTTKDGAFKLYATEITNLGAVFNCDWQGVPKIQPLLVPTTFKMPPILDEYDETARFIETTGQVDIGGNEGLFFDISCAGLTCSYRQCLNFRHICEFGVDLDEIDIDPNGNDIYPDYVIGSQEIESNSRFVRDVLFGLNISTNNMFTNYPYSTDFNLPNCSDYNFGGNEICNPSQPTTQANGSDYLKFRGSGYTNSSFSQPEHSYYFYFGIVPGATGLDLMNSKFFTRCYPEVTKEFLIKIVSTTATTTDTSTDGAFSFSIINGLSTGYTYTISGPNATFITGTVIETPTGNLTTIGNLPDGDYIITVQDTNGTLITQTFTISGPTPLYADAYVIRDSSGATCNGEISLSTIGGGSGTYYYVVHHSNGSIVPINGSTLPQLVATTPTTIGGLCVDITSGTTGVGYYIVVTDSNGETVTIPNLAVAGVTPITLSVSTVNPLCFGDDSGTATYTVIGGNQPIYVTTTTSVDDSSIVGFNISGLTVGTYTATASDTAGQSATSTYTLVSQNPEMDIELANADILRKQCDPLVHTITFSLTTSSAAAYLPAFGGVVYIQTSKDGEEDEDGNPTFNLSQTPLIATNIGGGNYTIDYPALPPSASFNAELRIRLCNPAGTCWSDFDVVTKNQVMVPLMPLEISATDYITNVAINNSAQCIIGKVKFKFAINQLAFGMTFRAPYLVEYRLTALVGGIPTAFPTPSIGNPNPVFIATVSNYLQEILCPFQLPPNTSNVVVTIVKVIDNVGCESNSITLPSIQLPTQAMTAQWLKQTNSSIPAGFSRYWVYITGGLPPYTGFSGPVPYQGPAPVGGVGSINQTTFPGYLAPTSGGAVSSVLTDSSGCQFTTTSPI
jgi:hypothetical protein